MFFLGEAGTGLSEGLSSIKTALADFSVSNIVEVIGVGLSIAVPLILIWFGFRWVYRRAKGALKRG